MKRDFINVYGAGLAGCEAAWQIAQRGVKVRLFEMKPHKFSPAHHSEGFAELVCSNSLRSDSVTNGVGLLKEELRRYGSLIMSAADATRVPAGSALAVDRHLFSDYITEKIKRHKNITVRCETVDKLPENGANYNIIIENCTFGFCHCILTCGSETIHSHDITVRNCTSNGAACLLSLKMRPDTNQLNENILVENIKGYCKKIFSSYSFTQFRRSPDLHMSYGRNITLRSLDLKCDTLFGVEDSIEYELENINVYDCNFVTDAELQIKRKDGREFNFSNVNILSKTILK